MPLVAAARRRNFHLFVVSAVASVIASTVVALAGGPVLVPLGHGSGAIGAFVGAAVGLCLAPRRSARRAVPAPADLVVRPLGPRPVDSEPVRLALTLAFEVAVIMGYAAWLNVGVVIPAVLFIAVSLVALIVEPHVVRGLEGFAEPVAASRNPFRPTRWYRLSPSGKPSQPSR